MLLDSSMATAMRKELCVHAVWICDICVSVHIGTDGIGMHTFLLLFSSWLHHFQRIAVTSRLAVFTLLLYFPNTPAWDFLYLPVLCLLCWVHLRELNRQQTVRSNLSFCLRKQKITCQNPATKVCLTVLDDFPES